VISDKFYSTILTWVVDKDSQIRIKTMEGITMHDKENLHESCETNLLLGRYGFFKREGSEQFSEPEEINIPENYLDGLDPNEMQKVSLS